MTFSLAHPLTVALYGEKYESSWRFLQLLSLSYYCNVATGFNGLTLRVLGKLRSVVALNIAAVGLSVLLDVLLIPRWGGAGAAVATAVAMIVYNLLKQIALRYSAHLRFFEWQYASFYLLLIGGAAGLAALQWAGVRSLYWTMPAAAAVSVFVVLAAKDKLRIEENFPELLRLPGLGRLLRLRLPVRGGR